MKETWKLIELLNEYSKNIWYFNEEDLQWQTKAWILSKEFWWIKWLVENDKIDYDKVNRESRKLFVGELRPRTPRYKLLILLSISDTPIEDLISYLK